MDYETFLSRKSQLDSDAGFESVWMPSFLFDFQASLVTWALRKGRAAVFADTGLGKGPMALVWAENIIRHTNGRVLILTPIAVGSQLVREAEKFGMQARQSRDGAVYDGITVTNYQQLHKFSPADFVGVACDESSILKCFDGVTKAAVTEFLRTLPYRLLCTATPSPNDITELGTSSEALGYLGHMDLLNRFFKNDQNTSDVNRKWAAHGGGRPKWRFKGHAEQPFWRFVCSWARAIRKPSDLGFDDARFALPNLVEREHIVKSIKPREGCLFAMPAHGLAEVREERKRTSTERCEKAASLVSGTGQPAICWAETNTDADLLEKLITGSVQVSGSDSDEAKEEKFDAFINGEARVLITKMKIGAFGLNFQCCSHMTLFSSYSYEQSYQAVRRCHRYGQRRPVIVDYISSNGETEVLASRRRKAAQADRMFQDLVRHMNEAIGVARPDYESMKAEVPAWI